MIKTKRDITKEIVRNVFGFNILDHYTVKMDGDAVVFRTEPYYPVDIQLIDVKLAKKHDVRIKPLKVSKHHEFTYPLEIRVNSVFERVTIPFFDIRKFDECMALKYDFRVFNYRLSKDALNEINKIYDEMNKEHPDVVFHSNINENYGYIDTDIHLWEDHALKIEEIIMDKKNWVETGL